MQFYFADDAGQSIVFQRINPATNVPAAVRILVFRKGVDITQSEPDLEFEINADAFKKMASIVT